MEARGHAIIPSSALVPENDPTTLFTGSGMQPLVPYLLGESHPKGTRLTDSQKCFRAEDIDEVGDNRHTTFFEMLGNWSLGDYFKKEQLPWFYEFLTNEIKLDPSRLYVTVYHGDESVGVSRDDESIEIWKQLFADDGINAEVAEMVTEEAGAARGMRQNERIFTYGDKNWWSRVGKPANMPVGEIGGPDSEVFYDFGTPHDSKWGAHCHPNCDCGRFLEIGNSVFMEYTRSSTGFERLPQQNVDFGGGLERITAAANDDSDVFKVDLLWSVVAKTESLSGKNYRDNTVAFRVITDHIRGATFMIGDGVLPSNTEQGYFVRRLLRRTVRYADQVGVPAGELKSLAEEVIHTYETHYTNLKDQKDNILSGVAMEEEQFRKTLEKGMKEFEKVASQGQISGEDAFVLFTTYGFPFELTEELALERNLEINHQEFEEMMSKHQEQSRAGAEQKFKGGLADHSEKVVQYHTATHLLLAGLRKFLGAGVHQAGSNITGERLRFDFTYLEKVEKETLEKVADFVNAAIQTGGTVTIDMMPKSQAENDPTIEGSFWDRYPDEVKVYTITGSDGEVFSRELCGGPHVKDLSEIKGTFRIKKEESSSAGVRRIKAVLK